MEVLDMVAGCEAEAQGRRLQEYRVISNSRLEVVCVPGGVSCGVEA